MTTISDSYAWCSVVPGSFREFPVKSGPSRDSVIITNGQHLICVVQVAERQTIKSWSAKQLFSFTCPAIFDHVQEQYCVVQNGHLLRQWTNDVESLMSSHKAKFTEKIYTILDFHCLEPVVVFSKGDCQTLRTAVETKKSTKYDYIKEAEICWAAGCSDNTSYYVALITVEKQSSEKTVHWIRILKSNGIVEKHRSQSLSRDGTLPLSWCLKQDGEKALVYVLWSDGELHSYDYENVSKNMFKVDSVTENCTAAMCCLNSGYIAITVIPKNKGPLDPTLEIWDINFSIIKEKRSLPFLGEDLQISYVNGILFLLNGNDLRGIVCNLQSSSLASVVGSAQTLSRKTSGNANLLVKWTTQGKNDDIEEVNMECERFQDLLQMESTGQTVPYLWKQLFSDFNHKSDLAVLENALERWKHVPEEILGKALEFCLSARSEAFATLTSESFDIDKECPFPYPKAVFLNKLLYLPFNDIFIHKHLQAIPFQHVMALLQYLLYLLKTEEKVQSIEKRPPIQVVCAWLCILFDAHFSSFILSRDNKVHQLVLQLTDATKTMLLLYKDLDSLEELLIFAKEKLQSTQARPPTPYCIEMLCI